MNQRKTRFLGIAILTGLSLWGGSASAAGGSYRLDTEVYVFKQSEFQSIKYPPASEAAGRNGLVLHSPATIEFDHRQLSLEGAHSVWGGNGSPPAGFSRIETPAVILTPGSPVSLLSALPVQYLEKAAGDSLAARDIAKDSPDAPHWRLTYTLESADGAGGDVRLACDLDVASMTGREAVPGVTLPVGKPELARFNRKLDLQLRPGQWSALVVRSLNGSNYTLLTLVKLAPNEPADRTTNAERLMTAKKIAEFATYYYRRPQPDLIGKVIASLGPSKFLDRGDVTSYFYRQSEYTSVGFFAEVFAANPERMAEWNELADDAAGAGDPRFWLRKARQFSAPGAILALGVNHPSTLSGLEETWVFWGAFFASGNPAYLRKIIDRLSFVDNADQELFDSGAEAMLLLAYNAPHHPLVRQTLEAARKTAEPRTRKLIDDVLNKDVKAVVQEIRAKDHSTYSNMSNAENLLPWRRPFMPPPISGRDTEAKTRSGNE